jgi:hypothetical protein
LIDWITGAARATGHVFAYFTKPKRQSPGFWNIPSYICNISYTRSPPAVCQLVFVRALHKVPSETEVRGGELNTPARAKCRLLITAVKEPRYGPKWRVYYLFTVEL